MCRLLGSETFAEFYGMAAPLECDSYLAVKDRLLVSDHYRKLLPELYPRAYPVVMTYRPTRLRLVTGTCGSCITLIHRKENAHSVFSAGIAAGCR